MSITVYSLFAIQGVAAVDSLEEFQKIVADKSSTAAADATAAATQK